MASLETLVFQAYTNILKAMRADSFLGYGHILCGQLERFEYVLGEAGIEPVRNFRLPRRLKAHTDLVVLDAVLGIRFAYHCGAGHLAGQITDETMTADAHNVTGLPFSGRIA